MLFLHVCRSVCAPIIDQFTRIFQRRQQFIALSDQFQDGGRVGGGDVAGVGNVFPVSQIIPIET